MPTPNHYSRTQIILHWVIMVLVLFNITASDGVKAMYDAFEEGTTVSSSDALFGNLHIYVGISVLALAILRLFLRLRRGAPAAPAGPILQQKAGHYVHIAIYVLLFTLPLSGIAAWFGGIGKAGDAHEVMQNLLLILVGLHVAAALFHQFWLKDNLITRMTSRK
jgi:cytochrome b561